MLITSATLDGLYDTWLPHESQVTLYMVSVRPPLLTDGCHFNTTFEWSLNSTVKFWGLLGGPDERHSKLARIDNNKLIIIN